MRARVRSHKSEWGMVRIKDDVIGRIASIAAREVPGVVEVWEGVPLWGEALRVGGVRVQALDQELRITLPVVVAYGVNVAGVAVAVQERVRDAVYRMMDIGTLEVDVSIHGVREGRP